MSLPACGGYICTFITYINMDPTLFPESQWTLTCESNKYDLSSVSMHEAGHVLGLKHPGPEGTDTGCTSTVMRSQIGRGDCYSCGLFSWDELAIDAIYNFDPAATVDGFAVIAGVAGWKVTSEHRTARYRIDGANSFSGPWQAVAMDSAGVGFHVVDVSGGGFGYFRLVEEEIDGRLRGLALAEASAQRVTPPAFVPPDPAGLRSRLDSLMTAAGEASLLPQTSGAVCVIFTDSLFVGDVESYVAGFWRLYGYDVRVVEINGRPANPDSFRVALKASIAAWADTTGASYFHLIGDANDWREFDGEATPLYWVGSWENIRQGYLGSGYPSGGEPEKDIIPTFAVADTAARGDPDNMTYLVPYYLTDQPYADTDDDSVPDVVVTRWPVSESWQLLMLAVKMQNYNLYGYSGNDAYYNVGAFAYDRNINVFDGSVWGWRVRSFVDSLAAQPGGVPSVGSVSQVYGKDFSVPVPGPDIAASWNAILPDVVIMDATDSQRYFPCRFFDKAASSNPFYVGLLSGGRTPVVVAGSCASSDWARTEDADYGAPLCEEMLYQYDDRGAVAWVGPSQGTWLAGNEVLLWALSDSLLANPTQPMAESYLGALQAVYTQYAGKPRILRAVESYSYLGDPLSPLMRPSIPTAVDLPAPSPGQTTLGVNYPNPFNPSTTIPFSVGERSWVTLTIYDVGGRRVRVLVDQEMASGPYVARWDGRNTGGQRVSSGVYFAVLKTEARQFAQKLVLVQ